MSLDRHVIGSETLFDQASRFLKKFVSQSASKQIWRLTCGSRAGSTSNSTRTASDIKTVLLDVMNQLASNADLDYGLYKLNWL